MYIKETQNEIVRVSERNRSGRFAMLDEELLARTDIGAPAKLVYAVLRMESFGAVKVAVSNARIALGSGLHRQHIREYLQQLESARIIELVGILKQVREYRFIGVAVSAGVEQPTEVKSNRRPPQLAKCLRCENPAVVSRATGWCRTCAKEARIWKLTDGVARKAGAEAGREAARQEIQKAVG